jgi:hypothetical protein
VCPTKPKAVSNNHFDEDGLAGIFTMLQPTTALRHRDLVLDVTQADDFGVFVRREAARIVVLSAQVGLLERSGGISIVPK